MMDVAKMSTEDLQALKAALSGSVMSPDVVPLEGDRSKVPEMLVGRLPLRNAVDLTAARMFKNDDDEAVAGVLKQSLPGSEIKYDMDPQTGMRSPYIIHEGKPYYINRPGFSGADVEGVVGNVAGFLPAGRFAQAGKTLTSQALRASGGAGVTSLAGDAVVNNMGGGTGIDLPKAATNAAIAPIAQVIGAKLFPVLSGKQLLDTFGNLTPEGAKALRTAGLDPSVFTKEGLARLNDAYRKIGGAFEGDAITALGSKIQADQFNIPLTLGQQTGNVRQVAREEAMRNYARGEGAGTRMGAFDQQQRDAIAGAVNRETGRLSGRDAASFGNEYEAGASLGNSIQQRARDLKGEINSAYDEAGAKTLEFKGRSLGDLKNQVEAALNAENVTLKPDLTPASLAAIERVKAIKNSITTKGSNPTGATWSRTKFEDVDFRDLDTTRKQLNGLYDAAKNPADRRGVQIAIKAFDKWIDDAVDAGLTRGDQGAIDALKKARELRTKYGNRFEVRKDDADAGKIMERIVNTDVTPNEVANLLIGYSDAGQSPVSVRVAARLKEVFGDGSPEWNQYREAVFQRMTNGPKGTQTGAQAIVSRFDKALTGNGMSLTKSIFSEAEIDRMLKFRDALKRTIPPKGATNPSGSGYEVSRAVQDFGAKLLGLKAATSADPVAAVGALGARAGSAALNTRAANQATQGVAMPPGRGYAAAPGVAAVAGDEGRRRVRRARDEQ